MKRLFVTTLLFVVLVCLLCQPIQGIYWTEGSYSDRERLVTACKTMDPSGLAYTQQPEIYTQLYDIITGVFQNMLENPQAYQERDRFHAVWRHLVSHSSYDTYDWAPETPRFARLLLEGGGACQDYVSAMTLLLECLDIQCETMYGWFAENMPGVGAGGAHVWNRVCLDGVWYHTDPSQSMFPVYLYNDEDLRFRYYRWDGGDFCAEESIPMGDYLASTEKEGDFYYQKGTGVLIGWDADPTVTELILPERVCEIAAGAFQQQTGLVSVQLPENLLFIDSGAFQGCTSLQSLELPHKLRTLGYQFVAETALREIVVPASVRKGNGAFRGSNLETVTFADGCTQVFDEMLYQCTTLREVNLPRSMRYIGISAFFGCTGLETLDLSHLQCEVGVSAFAASGLVSLQLPRMAVLQDNVFGHCKDLEQIEMQEGLLVIKGAFFGCRKLGAVEIPASVAAIEPMAFLDSDLEGLCSENLHLICGENSAGHLYAQTYAVPVTVDPAIHTNDPPLVRDASQLGGVGYTIDYASQTVTLLGYTGNPIETNEAGVLELPDLIRKQVEDDDRFVYYYPVTAIGENAFRYQDMTEVRLPRLLTTMGEGAFDGCSNLKTVDLSPCFFLTEVPAYAFFGCEMMEWVELGDQVVTIGDNAFAGCRALESFKGGAALETVGVCAFAETSLRSVYLGSRVKMIQDNAMSNLGSTVCAVIFAGDAPRLGENAFGRFPGQVKILHKPEAVDFDTEPYAAYEVGTYVDDSRIAVLDAMTLYEPDAQGNRRVYLKMLHLEDNPECRVFLAFYDDRQQMQLCNIGWAYAGKQYSGSYVQKTVSIPEQVVRMSVFVTEGSTLTPVAHRVDFDLDLT